MQVGPTSTDTHPLTSQIVQFSTNMFNNAPYPALSGVNCPYLGFLINTNNGIDLVIINGTFINEVTPIELYDNDTNTANDFVPLKQNNFNSILSPYFHYGILGHNAVDNSGGTGDLPGNDFVITQGIDDDFTIAATFVHELGHNLGLFHGGFENENCKPNYFSIMNYAHSFGINRLDPMTLAVTNQVLDYSRIALLPLNETSLIEPLGVQDLFSQVDNFEAFWSNSTGLPETGLAGPGIIPLDWDGDNNPFEIGIPSNINAFAMSPRSCPTSNGNIPLISHDDWSNLDFNFRDSLYYRADLTQPILDDYYNIQRSPEPTIEELESLQDFKEQSYVSDLLITQTVNNPNPSPGEKIEFTINVTNNGNNIAQSIKVINTFPNGTKVTQDLLALNPNESVTTIIPFTVPTNTSMTSLINTAEVSGLNIFGNQTDVNLTNNKASITININNLDNNIALKILWLIILLRLV
jgi:uncharacterized repeat protein (TIGR01451 family)